MHAYAYFDNGYLSDLPKLGSLYPTWTVRHNSSFFETYSNKTPRLKYLEEKPTTNMKGS